LWSFFFSWCSWKAKPPDPTAAAAATSSSILWRCACSGSFFASCFSYYMHVRRRSSVCSFNSCV
jgi:hypothetical protein